MASDYKKRRAARRWQATMKEGEAARRYLAIGEALTALSNLHDVLTEQDEHDLAREIEPWADRLKTLTRDY